MSARRQWVAATGCAAVLGTATVAAAPVAAAADATFYLSGTRAHPAPAAEIDLSTVSQGLSAYGVAQQIPYLASLYPAQGATPLDLSVATGVAATQAAIAAVPDGDRIVIVDVSQGGIVASLVEREQLAAGSTRNFLFVRVGDPSAPTGIMGRNTGIRLPGLTFVTAPNDSPWDRIIISHQYEGLSDWPVDQLNLLADLNALLGAVQYHNPWSYNVDLATLPDTAVTVTVNAAGGKTTTYQIPATGLLPILTPFKAAGINDATLAAWQKALKPIIDSAYEPQKTSPVAAVGTKLFVAAVNGVTGAANRAGAALRQTQRYLDTAVAQWKAAVRPKAVVPSAAVPTGVASGTTSPSVPEATPIAVAASAPLTQHEVESGTTPSTRTAPVQAHHETASLASQSTAQVAPQPGRELRGPAVLHGGLPALRAPRRHGFHGLQRPSTSAQNSSGDAAAGAPDTASPVATRGSADPGRAGNGGTATAPSMQRTHAPTRSSNESSDDQS